MEFGRLKIKERCSVDGKCLIRRGIPFAQGELGANEQIALFDSDFNSVKVQTRVLQTYSDGSIRWLGTAFETELKANEEKELAVCKSTSQALKEKNIAQVTENGFVLENALGLRLVIENHSILSLSFGEKTLTSQNGITLKANVDNRELAFVPVKSRLLENGEVFAQLVIEGRLEDSDIFAALIITMSKSDARLYLEAKWNARDEVCQKGQWIEIMLPDDSLWHKDKEWAKATHNGISTVFSSKDVERFLGAADKETGFFKEGKAVRFAPVQYKEPFIWPDGITRTFRLVLSVTEEQSAEKTAKRDLAWSFHPPTAVLSQERYVKAGYLESVCRSGAVVRMENLVTSLYGKCWHHIEAGKMPHNFSVDYNTDTINEEPREALHRSHGELEYNLWFAFMNSGNEIMTDMLSEHSEFWTDIMLYRGKHEFLHGEIRYKSGMSWKDDYDFTASTPYYADFSGLYFSYMMTGDAYLGECLHQVAYHMLEGFEKNGYPLVSYWFTDKSWLTFYDAPDYQTRFAATVRCMFYGYELYHDERFLKVTETTIDYMSKLQHEEGLFFEAYDRITMQPTAFYQSPYGEVSQEKFAYLEKIYIMLFGARGICEYYNLYHYEPTLEILENLGDYIWRQMQDDGWFFAPNSTDHFFDNEGARGCCGVTTGCAVSFFSSLFCATGKKKHLLWLLKSTRFYLSCYGGKAFGYHLSVGPLGFLRCAPRIAKLLKENSRLVIQMGYYDVLSVFCDETTVIRDKSYDSYNGHISKHIFNTPNNKVQYYCVNTGGLKPTYSCFEKIYDLEETLSEDGRLWLGEPNFVVQNKVQLKRTAERVDLVHLMETDIYLTGNENQVRIDIYRLTSEEITFNIKGTGQAELIIRNGLFPVNNEEVCMLAYRFCESYQPKNGEIKIPITLNGELQYFKICKQFKRVGVEKK